MKEKNSCFLFLGSEIGEKKAALDELRKNLSTNYKSPAEETVYYAGEIPTGDIISNLQNSSLFADSRLFLIKNAENIKKKEDIDLFASYIISPQSDTVLVFISEENSIAKAIEKNIPPGAKRVFYELSDSRKSEWIRDFFYKHGFKISNDSILTILELVENNTEALARECTRLIHFLEKDKDISPAEIEKWLSHTKEESAFTLFSRISTGDFIRSLESLRMLLAAKVDPIVIFSGLLWCFKKLRDYLSLKEAGVRDDFEYRKIGIIAPQAKRDYSSASRIYNTAGVEFCISLTAEYDYKIRSSNTFPKYILMDEYLYKIHFEATNI